MSDLVNARRLLEGIRKQVDAGVAPPELLSTQRRIVSALVAEHHATAMTREQRAVSDEFRSLSAALIRRAHGSPSTAAIARALADITATLNPSTPVAASAAFFAACMVTIADMQKRISELEQKS